MNIKFYTNNTEPPNYHSSASAADKTKPAVGKAASNYDKATFNKPAAPVDDSEFARVLAREAAARLEQSASPEKVARLQQQVASGTYQPNARTIAERMLGYR